MNKEWWTEKYDEICRELYDCEPWQLTILQRIEFDLKANEIIRDRWADLVDRKTDELR